MISVSKKLSAADFTATTTSPAPGTGSGRSVNSRSSGPPKRVQRMAFMDGPSRVEPAPLYGAPSAASRHSGAQLSYCLHIVDFSRYFYDFGGLEHFPGV